nr:FAD-dependent oxidoreductase [Ruegeria sp. HKCCC1038]
MPTRRTFLNQAGAATAFAFAAPAVRAQTGTTDLDIAIVGGGVAGLFCAMRLSEAPNTRVGVFEATDRIGGRLLSLHFPNLTSQTAEIGGMRLRRTDKHALKIVDEMIGREKLQDFAYSITGYYLRGQHFSKLSEVTSVPYGLSDRERAVIARGDDLLTYVIDDLNKRASEGTLSLKDTGLWELLLQQRSRETYDFVRDVLGYNSPLSNWDSKTAISWFERDFAYKTKYFKLDHGLEQIPKALARAYVSNGGKVQLGHKLVNLRRLPDAGFDLTFQTEAGQTNLSAARVILAIPPNAFPSLINTEVFSGDTRFARAVKSVHKVPLAKVHLAFDQDWWTPRNLSVGRVITDLPARQIYRWGVDDLSGHALLMASYHDGEMIEYWEALSQGSTFGAPDWIDRATGPD